MKDINTIIEMYKKVGYNLVDLSSDLKQIGEYPINVSRDGTLSIYEFDSFVIIIDCNAGLSFINKG